MDNESNFPWEERGLLVPGKGIGGEDTRVEGGFGEGEDKLIGQPEKTAAQLQPELEYQPYAVMNPKPKKRAGLSR